MTPHYRYRAYQVVKPSHLDNFFFTVDFCMNFNVLPISDFERFCFWYISEIDNNVIQELVFERSKFDPNLQIFFVSRRLEDDLDSSNTKLIKAPAFCSKFSVKTVLDPGAFEVVIYTPTQLIATFQLPDHFSNRMSFGVENVDMESQRIDPAQGFSIVQIASDPQTLEFRPITTSEELGYDKSPVVASRTRSGGSIPIETNTPIPPSHSSNESHSAIGGESRSGTRVDDNQTRIMSTSELNQVEESEGYLSYSFELIMFVFTAGALLTSLFIFFLVTLG